MKTPRTMVTAADVYTMLAARYRGDGWELIPQVPDGTGATKGRTADAIAFQTWPSKGLEWHGFEIKVARSDWLRELNDLSKSAPFRKFVDRWWIVAPSGVLTKEELPRGWGWLCPQKSGKLIQKAPAVPLEPERPDREFLAGVMRAFVRAVGDDGGRVRALVNKARHDARLSGEKDAKERFEHELNHAEKRMKELREWEEMAGFTIGTTWGSKRAVEIAAAARSIVEGTYNIEARRKAIRRARTELVRAALALREAERGLRTEER